MFGKQRLVSETPPCSCTRCIMLSYLPCVAKCDSDMYLDSEHACGEGMKPRSLISGQIWTCHSCDLKGWTGTATAAAASGGPECRYLLSSCQEGVASVRDSLVQPVQVGSHSHEVAVDIVQNDLQGGLIPCSPLSQGRVHLSLRLHHSLQPLDQVLILLQRFLHA